MASRSLIFVNIFRAPGKLQTIMYAARNSTFSEQQSRSLYRYDFRINGVCYFSNFRRDLTPCFKGIEFPVLNLQHVRSMAGHSHWQNVRHIKAAKDAQKAKTTDRFVKLVEVAVQKGGGPDPKLNKTLANTIEQAKRTQIVTNAALEAAIKRASGQNKPKNLRFQLYELSYTSGVLLLVEVETPNISKFAHDLKGVCRKFSVAILRGGVKEKFQRKGFVNVSGRTDDNPLDPDAALEVAIEAGAEEVVEIDGDHKIHQFLCDAEDFFKLNGALTNAGYEVTDSGVKYLPMVPVNVEESDLEKISDLCDELEGLPDVTGVHTNIA